MKLLTREMIRSLTQPHEGPCISLYQPTHRHHPDNQQDPIRFKNHLRELEESLRQKYPTRDVRGLLEPFRELAGESRFWNHTLDGLAILACPGEMHLFPLQRPVKDLLVVAESFHLKPLLRIVQSADRYEVLCLTRHTARILEGNRYALDPVELTNFPATITEALGEELTEPHRTVASYGHGPTGPAMHHGHGSRKDEIDKDTERYFRAVDRAVTASVSKLSGVPLLLAALPEHQPVFRAVSQNPALLPNGIEGNPESMSADQLREAAWRAMEPQYLKRLAQLTQTYQEAFAHQKGTADLSDAARAAVEGRIATLLVEADRVIPGRMDPATGAISNDSLADPEVDDLLDDLAEAVIRTGGEVILVPKERMPTSSGLAATYRY